MDILENTRRNFIKSLGLATVAAGLSKSLFTSNNTLATPNRILENESLNFLFQGDSITDGNHGRDADPNHIMGHGYVFNIASSIGADFCKDNHHFFNKGISGNTLNDLEKRWENDTIALNPDVLSILVGINDVHAFVEKEHGATSVAEFENTYKKLIEEAIAANPKIILILGIPFVAAVGSRKENFDVWQHATLERANVVRKLSKDYKTLLVDFPLVLEKATRKAPPEYWIWDGIHPTFSFHKLMSRAWIAEASKKIKFLKGYDCQD